MKMVICTLVCPVSGRTWPRDPFQRARLENGAARTQNQSRRPTITPSLDLSLIRNPQLKLKLHHWAKVNEIAGSARDADRPDILGDPRNSGRRMLANEGSSYD